MRIRSCSNTFRPPDTLEGVVGLGRVPNPGGTNRKTLRRLAGLAYERELRKELTKLHDQFHDWLKDQMDAFALSDAVHEFHDGAARDLYVFYTWGKPEMQVARAVAWGVLSRDEVPASILDQLKSLIEFFEEDSEGDIEDDAV